MSQELQDLKYFKENQLVNFDPLSGQLDVRTANNRFFADVGSINEDGYVRVWANGKLRMKHRIVYFLTHGKLPDKGNEIDHINSDRSDNRPSNLREVAKTVNNSGCNNRKFGKQLSTQTVHEICRLLALTTTSDLLIAKKVGVSRGTVRDIKTRRSRQAIGSMYQWPHRVKESSTTIETTS